MRRAVFFGAVLLAACGHREGHRHESFIQRLRDANAPNLPAGLSSERLLGARTRFEVEDFPGISKFLVLGRLERIEKAPCDRCHRESLERLVAKQAKEPRTAHWTVELNHAADSVMVCSTCHGREKMTELRTVNGTPVSFNHSYQLCGQCHSRQLQDWAGGAHGKRAGGWAPPRVVYSCAECHDPHQPRLHARWPAERGEASGIR